MVSKLAWNSYCQILLFQVSKLLMSEQKRMEKSEVLCWRSYIRQNKAVAVLDRPEVVRLATKARQSDSSRQFYLWHEEAGSSAPQGPTGQVWSHHRSNVSPLNASLPKNHWVDLLRKIL